MQLAPIPEMIPLDDLDPGAFVYLDLDGERVPALLAVAEPDGLEGFVTLHPHPRHPVPHWVHNDEIAVDELLTYPKAYFELASVRPISLDATAAALPGHLFLKEDELFLCFANGGGDGPQGFVNLATGEASTDMEFPFAVFAAWRIKSGQENGLTLVAHGVEA